MCQHFDERWRGEGGGGGGFRRKLNFIASWFLKPKQHSPGDKHKLRLHTFNFSCKSVSKNFFQTPEGGGSLYAKDNHNGNPKSV